MLDELYKGIYSYHSNSLTQSIKSPQLITSPTVTLPSQLTPQPFQKLKVYPIILIRYLEIKKTMDEETANKIRAQNEDIRKVRKYFYKVIIGKGKDCRCDKL